LQASVRASVLLGHHRYAETVAGNGRGDAERGVQTVKHGVGTSHKGAWPAVEQRAGRQVAAGP
jgi:hypothetical protein